MAEQFAIDFTDDTARLTLEGRLDAASAPQLAEALKTLIGKNIRNVVFFAQDLEYMSSAGLRTIVFAKQKIGVDVKVYLIAAKPGILEVVRMTGFDSFVIIQDSFEG